MIVNEQSLPSLWNHWLPARLGECQDENPLPLFHVRGFVSNLRRTSQHMAGREFRALRIASKLSNSLHH